MFLVLVGVILDRVTSIFAAGVSCIGVILGWVTSTFAAAVSLGRVCQSLLKS
jgi:hypothetical protein